MKIISIFRQNKGLQIPTEFTVGSVPFIEGNDPAGPPVACIKHFGHRYNGGKFLEGECYVIEFEDSPVKRIIPVADVVEVVVDTTKPAEVPDLPENGG